MVDAVQMRRCKRRMGAPSSQRGADHHRRRDIKAFIVERQQKLDALTAQINAATKIAAVEAVTWTFP